jgi:hypothetical protein
MKKPMPGASRESRERRTNSSFSIQSQETINHRKDTTTKTAKQKAKL